MKIGIIWKTRLLHANSGINAVVRIFSKDLNLGTKKLHATIENIDKRMTKPI